MAVFVKKSGAPTGTIHISFGGKTYIIDDDTHASITETDIAYVPSLLSHPYLQVQGGDESVDLPVYYQPVEMVQNSSASIGSTLQLTSRGVEALPFETAAAAYNAYLGIYFGGDDGTLGPNLRLAVSTDGSTFKPLGRAVLNSRDQDIAYRNGKYWCVFTQTPGFGTATTSFGIASSPDLVNWTRLADVSTTGAFPTVYRSWGPIWYNDVDAGILRVFIACTGVDSDINGFQIFEMHPTNDAMTTWSAPTQVTITGKTSVFDFAPIKLGANNFVALYKNCTNETIERATATSVMGPWTPTHTGDWAGWGAALGFSGAPFHIEGSHLMQLPNGTWRHLFDNYQPFGLTGFDHATEYYSDATNSDLTAWTAPKVSPLGRHARVRKLPINMEAFRTNSIMSHFEVQRTAIWTVPNNNYTTPIQWDTILSDSSGMSVEADNTKLVVRDSGIYVFAANAAFVVQGSATRFFGMQINDDWGQSITWKVNGGTDVAATISSPPRSLRRGDYIKVYPAQDTGGSLDLETIPPPRASLTRVG